MGIWQDLGNIFSAKPVAGNNVPKQPERPKNKRREVKDVKPGKPSQLNGIELNVQ